MMIPVIISWNTCLHSEDSKGVGAEVAQHRQVEGVGRTSDISRLEGRPLHHHQQRRITRCHMAMQRRLSNASLWYFMLLFSDLYISVVDKSGVLVLLFIIHAHPFSRSHKLFIFLPLSFLFLLKNTTYIPASMNIAYLPNMI